LLDSNTGRRDKDLATCSHLASSLKPLCWLQRPNPSQSFPNCILQHEDVSDGAAISMPTLKDINCSIELSKSHRKLQEFGTSYGDGFVETFVPVPSKPQSFSIHLTSNKFIAPGISMYVFVDGVYQCNRNRQDLELRKGSDSRSVVDFRVRQKEEKQKDGSIVAREWKFEKLDTSKILPLHI
jgi:hypothetical protein